MLMEAAKSSLLLIDVQERLLPAMAGGDEVARRCAHSLSFTLLRERNIRVSVHCP